MKKLIIFLILLLPLFSIAQITSLTAAAKPIQLYQVANSTTQFGTYLPRNTAVVDMSTKQIYFLTIPSNSGTSLASGSGALTIDVPTGLEKILESGNYGWRLIGFNAGLYGETGNQAVDLSIGYYSNNTLGALGDYSFASGKGTAATGDYSFACNTGSKASGLNSFASGSITEASGTNSTVMGHECVASGEGSFASGEATTASSYYAHAIGYMTIASGSTSYAEGNETVASGNGSHAEGEETVAQNTNQHSAGQYNVGTSATTIHETGIGTASVAKNGFEIHTTGLVWADHLQVNGAISVNGTGGSVFIGENAGAADDLTDNRNTFVGRNAGWQNTTGNYNIGIGSGALYTNTTGAANTAVGSNAMDFNITGTGNTAFGNSALYQNESGTYNTAVGSQALGSASGTESYNVAIGAFALQTNQYGSNVAIGYQAGSQNIYGTGNVFIGYQAGKNTSAFGPQNSNILYIDNSDTIAPLIYGNFASDSLVINGDVTITGKTTFTNTTVPATAAASGTQGEIVYGEDYIYICIQNDTWKRVAIATW